MTTNLEESSSSSGESSNAHPMITRGKEGVIKPNPKYALLANKHTLSEPKTVVVTLLDPNWTVAMGEEIDSFHITKTYSLVAHTPTMNILRSKWIF